MPCGLAVDTAPELDALLGSEERLVGADERARPDAPSRPAPWDHVVLLAMGDATLVPECPHRYGIAAGDQSVT